MKIILMWALALITSASAHSTLGKAISRQLLAPPSGRTSAEQCLTSGLASVLYSCPGYDGNSVQENRTGASNMRDGMIKLLQSCLLTEGSITASQNMTMKFLVPLSYIASQIVDLTSAYQKATGITVDMVLPTTVAYFTMRPQSINNPANRSLTHDAWLITPSGVGDGVASDAFMDLSQLVLYDQELQWQGILDQMRAVGLVYGSKVIALPISAYSFQLFYRTDTFKANDWTVPVTWTALIRLAQRANGTNNMWGFCGLWGPCGSLGTNLFKYILASYHQTTGATQGWLIDPDTMKLMLDSPAVKETLDILQTLYQLSPTDTVPATNCSQALTPFVQGACHMTITIGSLYKFASHVNNSHWAQGVQGNLGTALLPGSLTVLDRTANMLVNCDEKRCPYALKSVIRRNGTENTVWVNQSPGFEASLIPINAQSPATIQFYAFSVASYLARPAVSDMLVYDPNAEALPSRAQQLQPAKWQSYGYNLGDANQYCRAHSASMSHPNMHVQIRIHGATSFVLLFSQLMTGIMQGNDTTALAMVAATQGAAILSTSMNGNATALRLEYWSSINKNLAPSPPPLGISPPVDGFSSVPGGSSNDTDTTIILAIVIPAGAIILLVSAFLIKRMSYRGLGVTLVPGLGPDTTLLVTDIESSTRLWEELDPRVMDTAVKLHNVCTRKLVAQFQGYESVWEGDSFVVAFPTALAALEFATQLQTSLVVLDWPPALLAHPSAGVVQVTPRKDIPVKISGPVQHTSSLRRQMDSFSAKNLVVPANLAPKPSPSTRTKAANESEPSTAQDDPELGPQASVDSEVALPSPPTFLLQMASSAGYVPRVEDAPASTNSPAISNSPVRMPADGPPPRKKKARVAFQTDEDCLSVLRVCQQEYQKLTDKGFGEAPQSALTAFRGLRVRVGFHAGHHKQSDVVFNPASGRYVFTGSIRKAANAIAGFGLGGHVLMSSSTAARLGKDKAGVLRHLPEDVCVYHMGTHVAAASEAEQEPPMEVLLACPRDLTCRIAVMDMALRSHARLELGCLQAPASGANRPGSVALVAIHFSGLEALLPWNRAEAQRAVQQSLQCVMTELWQWRGVLSEEGVSLALYDEAATGVDVRLRLLTGEASATPGRLVAAFFHAHDAVQFAVAVRTRLLSQQWSDEILQHPLCEQVGSHSDNLSHAVFRELDSGGGDKRHSVSSRLRSSNSHRLVGPPPERCSDPGHLRRTLTAGKVAATGVDESVPASDSTSQASAPRTSRPSNSGKRRERISPVGPGSEFSVRSTAKPSSLRDTMEEGMDSATSKRTSLTTIVDAHVSDSPILRGLRIRAAIVTGPAVVQIATQSTGRALYKDPKTVKRLHKLLQQACAGQIVVDAKAMEDSAKRPE